MGDITVKNIGATLLRAGNRSIAGGDFRASGFPLVLDQQ